MEFEKAEKTSRATNSDPFIKKSQVKTKSSETITNERPVALCENKMQIR